MARFVLVQGSWSDATAWAAVADRILRSDGHEVAVPNLPAHGTDESPPSQDSLESYTEVVAKASVALGAPVALIGHSMAGTVISTVAEQDPELVTRLVYVAAFLLPSGQSLYGFTQSPLATPVTISPGGWGSLPRSYVHTSADRAVPLAAQEEMVTGVGGVDSTRSLDTSHMPMVSDPEALAAAVLDLTT
jgi:pimeloyl-ACP methyl ester carboxylesterase